VHRLPRGLGSLGALTGAIGLLARCSGSDLTLPGPPPGPSPAAITIVKGNAQSGTTGTVLPDSIVVVVTDSAGAPLADQQIEFVSEVPGAAITPPASTTGADGMAGARWVLGETVGEQAATARVVAPDLTAELLVTFSASAQALVPRLALRTQPSASARVGVPFEQQPEVQIRDSRGEDVETSGIRVTAALVSGPGSLAGTTSRQTNSEGRAEFTDLRIQGATGNHVLIFAADGYTSVTSNAIEVQPPPNLPPEVTDDEYTSIEGSTNTLVVDAANGVLQNDRDPEGGALTATEETGPPDGTVTLSSDGSFTYNPRVNFYGDDRFTYRAADPTGKSRTATVTIHVAPVNDTPGFTIAFNPVVGSAGAFPQTVSNFATGVTPGGEREDDQVLTFDVIGNSAPWLFAAGPTITRDGQGSTATLSFTPAGFAGVASVTIQLRDNGGIENGGSDTSAPQTFLIALQ
jgi:Bacterial Ig domain